MLPDPVRLSCQRNEDVKRKSVRERWRTEYKRESSNIQAGNAPSFIHNKALQQTALISTFASEEVAPKHPQSPRHPKSCRTTCTTEHPDRITGLVQSGTPGKHTAAERAFLSPHGALYPSGRLKLRRWREIQGQKPRYWKCHASGASTRGTHALTQGSALLPLSDNSLRAMWELGGVRSELSSESPSCTPRSHKRPEKPRELSYQCPLSAILGIIRQAMAPSSPLLNRAGWGHRLSACNELSTRPNRACGPGKKKEFYAPQPSSWFV